MPQGHKNYKPIEGTEHAHPAGHAAVQPTASDQPVTATIILHRQQSGPKIEEFTAEAKAGRKRISRSDFAARYGADPKQLAAVEAFAKSQGLEVVDSNAERRSVVVRGSAAAIGKTFAVELHDYDSPRGKYHGHTGTANLPGDLADSVEAVIGLDNRTVPAKHYSTLKTPTKAPAKKKTAVDPPDTTSLTPQQVAKLYNFPAGDGTGQTIGIYEMQTSDGAAGYSVADITASIKAFGGNLKVPQPIDVSVDGVTNSGKSDGETGLDITVAGAIAQGAKIAVYFTGGTSQSIVHALQAMIHPSAGAPEPNIISISYGWGPDDASADSFTDQEYTQIDQLFQDAANLSITVLVSSGDSGAFVESKTQAQTSFPASDPWVTACGGTTIGDISGASFDEYVWNDSGATGGGISARFPVPSYQANLKLPTRNTTKTAGRGVPDVAGNASPNSGYPQSISGQMQQIGGTSAVAPLYAGLIAIVNANLGAPAGFLNPVLYSTPGAFRNISSPPGPANNSYQGVTGYPATAGWNACTGWGSPNGTDIETALKAAQGKSA